MKIKSIKFLNICVWICAITYVFAYLAVYFGVNKEIERAAAIHASMLEQAKDFNNYKNYQDTNNDIELEEPIFFDAKSAIDYSYAEYRSSSCTELIVIGTVTASTMGMDILVRVEQIQTTYPSGAVLVDNRIYEVVPKYNISVGHQKYYSTDGYLYQRSSEDLKYNPKDNTIDCNYTSSFKKILKADFYTYTINKNTITKDIFFKTNYNVYTGKVDSYSASAKLNVNTAVKNYDVQIMRDGTLDVIPQFTDLEIHCTIDRNGQMKRAVINEVYLSKKTIMVLGSVNYKSTDNYNITFKFNQTPTNAEPKI